MKEIVVTALQKDVAGFFNENCVAKKLYTDGSRNLSVDGSGKDVSVGGTVGQRIGEYILKKFKSDGPLRVIDLGTGKGYLPEEMSKLGIEAYGLEGDGELAKQAVYDKNKVICCDLSVPIVDDRLHKAFHLTTSFELIEHIHRRHEDTFLRNLAFLSNYHLCSIHIDAWPGLQDTHCNIKHPCCWMEIFRKKNIECEVIGACPNASTAHNALEVYNKRGDILVPIPYTDAYNKMSHSEEFRENVRFGQWDEWKLSMFCILDFTNMYEDA